MAKRSRILHKIQSAAAALALNAACGLFFWLVLSAAQTPTPPVVQAAPESQAATQIQALEQKQPIVYSGTPKRLVVPSLDLEVTIKKGRYQRVQNSWTISKQHAYFATASQAPNNYAGTTFIYGHNSPGVFIKLHQLQPGAKMYIETENGYIFRYVYREGQTVQPHQIHSRLLRHQPQPMVTLQTCSGHWNQHRRLFGFRLESFER